MELRPWLLVLILLQFAASAAARTPAFQADLSCIKRQVAELAASPAIIGAVAEYNDRQREPFSLEAQWKYLALVDPDVQRVLGHPAAERIQQLIKRIAYQGEGFLIGANGGLVAATNKTTTYYQGNESQFSEAMMLRRGRAYVMEGVADVSARFILVKIATPVYRELGDKALGVLVVGFDQFVVASLDPCAESTAGPEAAVQR